MVGTTERLWLTDPQRKTALAHVTAVDRDAFRLDRSLFAPRSHDYRHPQVADHGTVWTPDGEKRRLVTVFERNDGLWHRLRGAVPRVGDRLQCHLDVDRRAATARAHTVLHLALHLWGPELGRLTADPEVRGGGHVRFEVDAPFVAPTRLAAWRTRLVAACRANHPIARDHVADDLVAHRLAPQPFADGVRFPGPETTREAVVIAGLGAYPCDGTLTARTGDVADVLVREARPNRDGGTTLVLQAR